MDKYIIRELTPESMDVNIMFDDDGLTAASGDFNNTLFVLYTEHGHTYGFNIDTYREIETRINNFIDDFTEYRQPGESRKSVMKYYNMKYSPRLCHALTVYANRTQYVKSVEDVARWLTITTQKTWNTCGVYGYCQGDYVTVLYCADNYTDKTAKIYGEYYLGCCKEFCVSEIDAAGNEIDPCYGFFVADCEIDYRNSENSYKTLVCDQAGIDINAARLELIESCYTTTHYTYKAV